MLDHAPLSWTFGDQTGWMVAGGFFALFSAAIGWIVAGLSSRLLTMGSPDQTVPASRRGSIILGMIVGGSIFSTLALTSLSGFAQLALQNGTLTLQYRWTGEKVVLPFIEVMNIQEEPAYKGQWRLVVVTDTSGTYESALSSQAEVHRAAERLRQEMARPFSLLRQHRSRLS